MIKYKNKDLYSINSDIEKFDIVIALEVLEHLKKPSQILKNLQKISKNKLIISVPNEPFFSLGNLLSLKNISRLGNPNDHVNKWTKKQFIHFLKENNIDNFKVYTSFPWTIVLITK